VKGTIQWLSAAHALPCEVRLYDRLFTVPDPDAGEGDFTDHLNPDSLVVVRGALIEPSVHGAAPGSHFQFERVGYFCTDREDSTADALVFNRTVTLRDTWAKSAAAKGSSPAPAEGKRKQPSSPSDASATPKPRIKAPAATVARTADLEGRRARYESELGRAAEEADALTRDPATAAMFEVAMEIGGSASAAAHWMIHELPRELGGRSVEDLPFGGREVGALVRMVEAGDLSTTAARQVLAAMANGEGEPAALVETLGLRQVSDEATLAPVVDEVIGANAAKADEYRAGKTGLLGFFVGQVMRKTGGTANPELVSRLVAERLAGTS
jgi:glutaminyl-tRNA synthetase